MLPKKIFVLFLFLLLHAIRGYSQQSEKFSFTHYRLTDGLSSNIVNNIVQDSSGFIWLSTNNGLQRFDGNKFITFKADTEDPTTIHSDEVTQVYLDKKNRLWVTTADNRIGIFNTYTFRYKEVPVKGWQREKAKVHLDKSFIETEDGTLLLHMRWTNRLFQYDASVNAFVPSTYIPFPDGWNISCIFYDKATSKYFMASDSGFVVYNPKTKTSSYPSANKENELLISQCGAERFVNYIFVDKNRQLFFEEWPKSETHPLLKILDLKTGRKKEYNLQKEYGLGYHQIRGMMQQQDGKTWIFGLPFLAEVVNGSSPLAFLKKDYNKEKDLKFNQANSMYEDRQHNVWICTDYGIYLFNPDAQLFHNYTLTTPKRYAVEGRSQTALQLPNNEIWIGYRDLGLYRYTSQLQPLPLPASIVPYQNMKSVWGLHLHSKTGKLWITMQGGNLIVYDTLTRKAQAFSPAAFEKRAITQITEDKNGNLWLGTQGGNLVKWDMDAGSENIEDGFSLVKKTGVIEKMFTDQQGFVWVGAVGEGLLKIDPSTDQIISQITESSPEGYRLWNNNPKDILQYNDSLLVVASGALNIINLRTMKVQHISNRDGLPTNTVQSLAKDAAGMLWLGTMNGLCVTDINKLSFTVYDQSDGLLNDHFNVAGAHNLNDGRLLFTSAESFLIFDPSFTRKKDPIDKAFITDFKLMNKSLSVDSLQNLKQINLAYNTANVVIEFSALNFSKLNKLDYYYQLENFDSTWVKSDDRHQAIYTYLPPGKYWFKVKTKNIAGVSSPEIFYFAIRVNPPFWKTWWFYMLIILLVATILYLIYRERIKRLITLHNVRSDIASHLHQDVSTTLNNINVLSQIAKLKADKDVVRSKEIIDEISGKSYNMMLTMDEILWSIDPGNDTMEKTLLRLFEFAKMLETNYGAVIDIVVHEKVKDLRLNMKVRHDFFLVCKEALQYLAQHARDKSIMVDIDFAWSKIQLKILCVGAELDEGSIYMLELKKNMQEKASSMDANLIFENGKKDISIIFTIPVKSYSFIPYSIFGSKK
jgi:ligand-binding sensor domain-containing protein/signal transduction histidine kinase